jgi:hypothetical protein
VVRAAADRRPLARLGPARRGPPPPPPEERRYLVRCRELRSSAGERVLSHLSGRPIRLYAVREISSGSPRVLRGSMRPVEASVIVGEIAWALLTDLTADNSLAHVIGPALAEYLSETLQPGEEREFTHEDLAPWLMWHALART